jgi:signal transduction histidine kinase
MQQRNLVLAGILTWLMVAATHVSWQINEGVLRTPAGIGAVAGLLAFVILFWFATRDRCKGATETALTLAQSIAALAVFALQPQPFIPVLLVVIAGELGHLRTSVALTWITLQSLVLGALLFRVDADTPIPLTLAYFTFQLFGAFSARMAHEERDAKQALAEANAELRVATGLLDMSSRAEERLRIARDLHDLIGHHLTALSLNLEVASHLTNDAARPHVEKSQALTKLLLSDVRDTVSRLRDEEPVDLGAALRSIRDAVPSPSIHVDAGPIDVTDATTAETALRAVQEIVTNAVRHSGARNLWLALSAADHELKIDARDDGSGTDQVRFGNGLRGMRERVQHAGGTIDVASMRGRGFEVHIRLPLARSAA